MTISDQFERTVRAHKNYGRAQTFDRPVLRSLFPDAILVGYSVTALNDTDTMVESNQVTRSSLAGSTPVAFTSRTWKSWDDSDAEWHYHAMDHVMNTQQGWHVEKSSRTDRNRLLSILEGAERFPLDVLVDGDTVGATAFRFEHSTFARFFFGTPLVMVTIAAPGQIIQSGFTTEIGEDGL